MKNCISSVKKTFFAVLLLIAIPFFVSAAGLVPSCGAGCGFGDFIQLIQNVINFLIFDMAMPLAAVMFAWAGILMLTAGGSTEKIKEAKNIFWWVFVGILIALAAWLIVSAIMGVLLGSSVSDFVKQNFLNF